MWEGQYKKDSTISGGCYLLPSPLDGVTVPETGDDLVCNMVPSQQESIRFMHKKMRQ